MDKLNTISHVMLSLLIAKILRYGLHFMLFILIGIFSLSGAPISAKTLHCPEFAVVHYSFTQGILCFHQPRRVHNPVELTYV